MHRLIGHASGPQPADDQLVQAWANFAGASGTINASYNVTSVTRNAAGDYTITWAQAFAGASTYALVGMAQPGAANGPFVAIKQLTAPTTTSATVTVAQGNAAALDATFVTVLAVGRF